MPDMTELQHVAMEALGLFILALVLYGVVEVLAIVLGGARGRQIRRLRWPLVAGVVATWLQVRLRRRAARAPSTAPPAAPDELDDWRSEVREHIDDIAAQEQQDIERLADQRDGGLARAEDQAMAARRAEP